VLKFDIISNHEGRKAYNHISMQRGKILQNAKEKKGVVVVSRESK
jgi:hypothetical protein